MNSFDSAGRGLIDFILKEWLMITSGAGLLITSLYIKHLPDYSPEEIQILFILYALFIATQGLQQSGLTAKISSFIINRSMVSLKLVIATFFLSMLITNDIALLILIPLTLTLEFKRKDVLIILEVLSANAGSALTPFGNPQNLFIYWHYGLHPWEFIITMAPLSLTFLLLLSAASFTTGNPSAPSSLKHAKPIKKTAYIYGALLILLLLSILRLLPISTGWMVIGYAIFFDRRSLRVDYALLITFFFFFGFAENIQALIHPEGGHTAEHIFLFSALSSQVMSNVPVTLLFAQFTTNWKALLWGTNAGGFGSLFGSFANLIAYRLYTTQSHTQKPSSFMTKFLIMGYIAFFLAIGLYFIL